MAVNSTAGCLDPTSAFVSPHALYQCFQVFLRPENFEDWEGNYFALNDTIGSNTTFGTMIGECLQQYCLQPDPGLGGRDYANFFWPTDGYSMFSLPYHMFSSPACSRISLTVNQDLCGPGAMIAYLMQLVIVFIIWLIVRVLQVVPRCIQYVYRGKKHRRLTASLKEKLSRHQSIAKSILIDFQEAQCFFVICIQAAIRIAFSGLGTVFGAKSLAQIYANSNEAVFISGVAILGLTCGLWLLHRFLLDSVYILVWSVTSIVLSAVTLFCTFSQQPTIAQTEAVSGLERLDKCGYHPPPLVYCYSSYEPTTTDVLVSPDNHAIVCMSYAESLYCKGSSRTFQRRSTSTLRYLELHAL